MVNKPKNIDIEKHNNLNKWMTVFQIFYSHNSSSKPSIQETAEWVWTICIWLSAKVRSTGSDYEPRRAGNSDPFWRCLADNYVPTESSFSSICKHYRYSWCRCTISSIQIWSKKYISLKTYKVILHCKSSIEQYKVGYDHKTF